MHMYMSEAQRDRMRGVDGCEMHIAAADPDVLERCYGIDDPAIRAFIISWANEGSATIETAAPHVARGACDLPVAASADEDVDVPSAPPAAAVKHVHEPMLHKGNKPVGLHIARDGQAPLCCLIRVKVQNRALTLETDSGYLQIKCC